MAFVDLWRGILYCDVRKLLQQQAAACHARTGEEAIPILRFVPTPSSIDKDKVPRGDARLWRNIAVVDGRLKYVELQLHWDPTLLSEGLYITDGWVAATFSRPTDISSSSDNNDDDNNNTATAWSAFAARVSGEWDGYSAEFTSAGDPVPLPENVVPEAFREWGVPVLDWQTQCPTLADPAAPPCALQYRLVRLLPTVGCEADAAAVHTSHQRHASSAAAFAYASGGSYVAAWPRGPAPVLEVEHCVVRPGPGGGGEEEVSRVRVVQTVALGKEARLRGVKVFSEQWYGPFRNGEQLGGCAVRETAFAGGEKLDVSEVLGRWESRDAAVARFSDQMDPETVSNTEHREMHIGLWKLLMMSDDEQGKFAELAPTEPPTTTVWRDADGVVTLPKQLWSAFKEHGDGEFLCEVGWALGGGSAVTSRCLVTKDGDVKASASDFHFFFQR
ncbi:hypothetical protein PR202_gb18452 [Eleusine coracana subsp. coracana]|uniref:DUF1618 domain-containing protein n=1 Tax=Eleusine coracana subsp. coracana TaxID=191504 RepID=A0AAV5F7F2_ELECO|nr:hypothetical protein PR202_gb18452 [Eleusine coracana subsp. coracana]